jgi:two-component system chemotaxis sensor kinase CheA
MLLLFRDLAGRQKAVPIAALERIEAIAPEAVAFTAGRLRVAIGERILPLAGCDAPPAGPARILRLTDGDAELAYAFAEVIDIRSVAFDLQPSPAHGEVAGVALIDGVQVELLDPYWLFATHADAAPAGERVPVCAIPAGDPWMETILRPLIESLGYRVVAAAEGVAADVLIASADAADAADAPPVVAGEVLRIRSRHQGSGENDNSIYRYDRAALLNALSRGAAKGRRHE